MYSDKLYRELIDRKVGAKDSKVIVDCYNKMCTIPFDYSNGIFKIKDKKGRAVMHVFISTPQVNSIVGVYSPGAYYQLYIEEEDIFIVYKRFGSFSPSVMTSYVYRTVRELLSKGTNLKKKIRNDNKRATNGEVSTIQDS